MHLHHRRRFADPARPSRWPSAAGSVVLLEATPSATASGRNGGFVFGGFSLGERESRMLGEGEARSCTGSRKDALQRSGAGSQHGIDCDLRGDGVHLANWFGDQRISRPPALHGRAPGVE
jgi:hypothetical protein